MNLLTAQGCGSALPKSKKIMVQTRKNTAVIANVQFQATTRLSKHLWRALTSIGAIMPEQQANVFVMPKMPRGEIVIKDKFRLFLKNDRCNLLPQSSLAISTVAHESPKQTKPSRREGSRLVKALFPVGDTKSN